MNSGCRICFQDSSDNNLITPCKCKGSIQFVHRACLEEWREKSTNKEDKVRCRICNEKYQFEGENKKELKRILGYSILFITFFLSCAIVNLFIFFVNRIILLLYQGQIYLFSYQSFSGEIKDDILYFYSVYLVICLSGMYCISKLRLPILFFFINFNFQTGCMIYFIVGMIYLTILFFKGLNNVKEVHTLISKKFGGDELRVKDINRR